MILVMGKEDIILLASELNSLIKRNLSTDLNNSKSQFL